MATQKVREVIHKMNTSKIVERRQKVLACLSKRLTEREIATLLSSSQPTIHRDIEELKRQSKEFVNDMARYFGYYYQEAIEGINQTIREAWLIYHEESNPKIRLQALALIKECSESKFRLLADGPTVLAVQTLGDKNEKIRKSA